MTWLNLEKLKEEAIEKEQLKKEKQALEKKYASFSDDFSIEIREKNKQLLISNLTKRLSAEGFDVKKISELSFEAWFKNDIISVVTERKKDNEIRVNYKDSQVIIKLLSGHELKKNSESKFSSQDELKCLKDEVKRLKTDIEDLEMRKIYFQINVNEFGIDFEEAIEEDINSLIEYLFG